MLLIRFADLCHFIELAVTNACMAYRPKQTQSSQIGCFRTRRGRNAHIVVSLRYAAYENDDERAETIIIFE